MEDRGWRHSRSQQQHLQQQQQQSGLLQIWCVHHPLRLGLLGISTISTDIWFCFDWWGWWRDHDGCARAACFAWFKQWWQPEWSTACFISIIIRRPLVCLDSMDIIFSLFVNEGTVQWGVVEDAFRGLHFGPNSTVAPDNQYWLRYIALKLGNNVSGCSKTKWIWAELRLSCLHWVVTWGR